MAEKSVKVLVLRRDVAELDVKYTAAIAAKFPGRVVESIRVDPKDHIEMDYLCVRYDSMTVALPADLPIPPTAMKRGVAFIDFRNGQVIELEPLVPTFKPFVPRT